MVDSKDSIELEDDEYIEVVNFGELQEGDVLLGSQGRVSVSTGFEEHMPESLYLIETDSGLSFEVSGGHLWYVVTAMDRDLHRHRLSLGRKFRRKVSKDSRRILEEMARAEESREVYVAEFEDILDSSDSDLRAIILRVAESLGPVAESNFYVDDLGGREKPLYSTTVQKYDGKLFARQLLSVFGFSNYRKVWPVIVGTVMSTEKMASFDPEELYIPDPVAIRS